MSNSLYGQFQKIKVTHKKKKTSETIEPLFRKGDGLKKERMQNEFKTGPEEAQYFHVRPPIGFI